MGQVKKMNFFFQKLINYLLEIFINKGTYYFKSGDIIEGNFE